MPFEFKLTFLDCLTVFLISLVTALISFSTLAYFLYSKILKKNIENILGESFKKIKDEIGHDMMKPNYEELIEKFNEKILANPSTPLKEELKKAESILNNLNLENNKEKIEDKIEETFKKKKKNKQKEE